MSTVLNLNQVILGGRLVFNPDYSEEKRESSSDEKILYRCRLRLAVTRKMRAADGVRATDFFDAIAVGKKAQVISVYFKKGDPIVLFGSFRTDTYTDKTGKRRESFTLDVDDFQFVESPGKAALAKEEAEK